MWVCSGCGATNEGNCARYKDCDTARACLECDWIYDGGIKCPQCGGPGEPLELEDETERPTFEDIEISY